MKYTKIVKKTIESVLLDPRVLESLCLAEANLELALNKYEEIDAYQDILKETIEDLSKIRFLITQLREGYIK